MFVTGVKTLLIPSYHIIGPISYLFKRTLTKSKVKQSKIKNSSNSSNNNNRFFVSDETESKICVYCLQFIDINSLLSTN